MRTVIYGIIFSLLFNQLHSSYFFFSDLCGLRLSSSNELDAAVYDPSSHYQRSRRTRLSDDITMIAPLPATSKSQSDSDFPQLKSILKKSKNRNKKTASKSVSFSVEAADEPEMKCEELTPIQVSFANRNDDEDSIPIFEQVPFDYDLKDAETLNDLMTTLNLPVEVVEMIKFNYPGLGNVRITVLDLAGLVLFATYYNHPVNFFITSNLLQFFDEFLTIFPFSLPLIQSIQVKQGNLKIKKMMAFDGLHRMAHKYSLYYTLEAVYKVFGQGNPNVFIKESIKEGDMKLFFRFIRQNLTINPDKLVFWSLKFGNEQVFLNFIDKIVSVQNLKKYFKVPIICHVASKGFYFRGIVDILLPLEEEYFSEALSLSITNGNHKLFKDLIRFDNLFFEKDHDPRILNVLRSIFYNQLSEDNVTVLESDDSLKEIFMKLLMLDSDDPFVISSFKTAFKDVERCEELLLESLFLKTRDYFKIIIETCPVLNYLLIVDNVKFGMWELMKDSRFYLEVLESFIRKKIYSILHSLSNLDFPKVLWPNLLKKLKRSQLISEVEYKKIARDYGFNEDILNEEDLISLGMHGKRIWSLLELAILNFNFDAVEAILERFPLEDDEKKQSATNLSRSLKDLIDSREYSKTHPMITLAIKQKTLAKFKERKPDFYFKDIQPIDSQKYIMKLRWNINSIIIKLLN